MILGYDGYWRDWTIPDNYQYSPPDWEIAKANGVRFVMLKAADGIEASRHFDQAYNDALAAGLYVGAYVWLDARSVADPKRQAEFWYSVLKDKWCPVSIDFEAYKDNIPDWRDLYDAASYYWQLDPLRNLGVYTNYWYWMEHGSADKFFGKLFNWSARYSDREPQLYAPWNRTDIWQWSGSGDPRTVGITNGKLAVDLNYWMGDENSLAAFFNQGEIPPVVEPPTGETMYKGTVTVYRLNVRSAPNSSVSNVVDTLIQGMKIEADRVENGWWHLTSIGGTPVTGEKWAYEGDTKGYIRTDAIVTPPSGSVKVEMYANGALIHSKDVAAGSTIRVDVTD